jgi:hypothetical protein
MLTTNKIFFNAHSPFVISYNPKLEISSNNDTKTFNLKTQISLEPSTNYFITLDETISTIKRISKDRNWKVDENWPFSSSLKLENPVIIIAVYNGNGDRIASKTITIGNNNQFEAYNKNSSSVYQSVEFKNIKADDIAKTDKLFVKIVSLNDKFYEEIISSEQFIIKKDFEISDKQKTEDGIKVKNDTLTEYSGTTKNIIISEMHNKSYIKIINEKVFSKKQINKVSIPNSVDHIKEKAFYDNNITSIDFITNTSDIPHIIIDSWAFAKNNLTQITIPGNVKTIKRFAFFRNKLKKITILSNRVELEQNSFDNGFDEYYKSYKRVGTYELKDDGIWTIK